MTDPPAFQCGGRLPNVNFSINGVGDQIDGHRTKVTQYPSQVKTNWELPPEVERVMVAYTPTALA
jgi:hypothetical protein